MKGKFGKILGLVLDLATIAEAVHGAGTGAEKKTMVLGFARQLAPLALQKAGYDESESEELVDNAFGAFEHINAFAKTLKK